MVTLRLPLFGARVCGARRARMRTRLRGFTLVELSVVVVIVGVLSVLAVVGYRRLILSSKLTEAQNVISAIRIAQEDYKAETGGYADLGTKLCPNDGSRQIKTGWDPTCSGGGTATWASLPVHVDGPVQFGYATCAGTSADVPTACNTTNALVSNLDVMNGKPWYVIYAQADLDGRAGLFTKLAAVSGSNQVFSTNEGE